MRIALFITCFNDTLFPGTGKSVVRLLRRLGHQVEFPYEQVCCGQMHVNTGYRRDAAPLVADFVKTFEGFDAIVTPSASCAAMARRNHAQVAPPKLRDRAIATAGKVFELSEFLLDVLRTEDVGAYFPHSVAYHPTCHSLRLLKVEDRPLRLLKAVRGLTLTDLPQADECCGFGGTFAVKNPETSAAIGQDKVHAVLDSGAQVLCALDNSCLMHIGGVASRMQAGVRVLHLADILASTEKQPDLPVHRPITAKEAVR